MAEDPKKPKRPPKLPFSMDEDEWESELASWDAALPIAEPAPRTPTPVPEPSGAPTERQPVLVEPESEPAAPPGAQPAAPELGAEPSQENPFHDTPTTVIVLPESAAEPDDAVAEFSEVPASGAYESIIATRETPPLSIFQGVAPPEAEVRIQAEPLAEMDPAAWRGGLAEMISVPAELATVAVSDADWRAAQEIVADELGRAPEARRGELAVSLARLAEATGALEPAARALDEALRADPTAPAALRARARLHERRAWTEPELAASERQRAAVLLDRLAERQPPQSEEGAAYRLLRTEWKLGAADAAAAAVVEARDLDELPDGIARALAYAEVALARSDAAPVAAALASMAERAGGAVGGALLLSAACFSEAAGDPASAAAQRSAAAAMDPSSAGIAIARLRDAARVEPGAAADLLERLGAALPPSPLAAAVARSAARLAEQAGDRDRARRVLEGRARAGGTSDALTRDRLDLAATDDPTSDDLPPLLEEAGRIWTAPEAGAVLALRTAAGLARVGAPQDALGVLERALGALPSAVPLAVAAGELGRGSDEVRIPAYRTWARFDPARRAFASLLLADREADPEPPLREAALAAPASAAFWRLAVHEARAGREDAADILGSGAVTWGASALASALIERSSELRATSAPEAAARQLLALAHAHVGELGPRGTLGRVLELWDDRDALEIYLREEAAGPSTPGGVASFTAPLYRADARLRWMQVATRPDGAREAMAAAAADVLALVPDHPAALALLLLAEAQSPEQLAGRLWEAARGAGGRLAALLAVVWLAESDGTRPRALALAKELLTEDPAWAPARRFTRRLARDAVNAQERAAVLGRLAADEATPAEVLEAAEAAESVADGAAAAALYQQLAGSPLDEDAARGLARLVATGLLPAEATPRPSRAFAEVPAEVEEHLARVRALVGAAAAGSWDEAVGRLEREPPHEKGASPRTLMAAALLDEGRGTGGAAGRLLERVDELWRTAPEGAAAPGLSGALRIADRFVSEAGVTPDASERAARALRTLARVVDDAADGRAAATFLFQAAHALAAPAQVADAERGWREALARDPRCLPALRSLRRSLVRRRVWDEAANLCEQEAAAMAVPAHRVNALVMAAQLVERADPARTSVDPARAAAGHLRAALAIDPEDQRVFDRLRAIYERLDDTRSLAELLAARMSVARNPFEVTALRLARAELLAGPLADRTAAKDELRVVLQKEPQHARALTRLAELCYADGSFAEAAELYGQRAWSERSPERLRDIYLHLGRIYVRHMPDPARAAEAYSRVLHLDAENREALDALSELYLQLGDSKSAIAATDRIVQIEAEPDRRASYLIRLGQLHERSGEGRLAASSYRAAVDQAPRSPAVIGELAKYLERTRDLAGKRALLDRSVFALRTEVAAGALELDVLRTLVTLLEWRGKANAAAAGAQLVAGLSEDPADHETLGTWAAPPPNGRSLAALARLEIDERTFPPGLPSAVRNIFRLIGPALASGAPDLKAYELGRADRVARGHAPRDLIDPIAVELGVREFEVYIKRAASAADPSPLAVEPGEPPALVLGAQLLKLGSHGIRFAAARLLRLVGTHLDLVLRDTPRDAGALLAGLIRQFVADYRVPELPDQVIAARAARLAKVLPRKLRQEVMPFAMEASSGFDPSAVHAAVRDGANAVGLLASGNLATAVSIILAARGRPLTVREVREDAEALSLVAFGLSDEYDDLCRALES